MRNRRRVLDCYKLLNKKELANTYGNQAVDENNQLAHLMKYLNITKTQIDDEYARIKSFTAQTADLNETQQNDAGSTHAGPSHVSNKTELQIMKMRPEAIINNNKGLIQKNDGTIKFSAARRAEFKNKKIPKVMRYQCNFCDDSFVQTNTRARHVARAHSNNQEALVWLKEHHGKLIIECELCDKIVTTNEDMHTHRIYEHGAEKWPECNVCGEQFKHPSSLRAHKRQNHLTEEQKAKKDEKNTCVFCNKIYARGHDLNRHLQTAHAEEIAEALENDK